MPLKKPVYPATNRGEKALLEDAKPGDFLYVIHEHAGNSGPARSYSQYVVTTEKNFWPAPGYKVENVVTKGKDGITGLLRREREIYRDKPDGLENRAINLPESAYYGQMNAAARRVADQHAVDAANDRADYWKRLATSR